MRFVLGLCLVVSAVACKQRDSQPSPEPEVRCEPGKRTCVGDDVVQCTANGSPGDRIESCSGQCRNGACVDTCALHDVELIYVADHDSKLYSFDPRKLPGDPFHLIGTLDCDESRALNSMAVDRSGVAWLDYHTGVVHRASIIDAHCTIPGATPRDAPTAFGMAFVTDGPKATTEKLFVAGGASTKSLAVLGTAPPPGAWTVVAPFEEPGDHPELTGTGDGRLFAYFPSPNLGFIEEVDRTTARAIGDRWVIQGPGKHVSAYAFAHWGGVFYVFLTADRVSSVYAVHMKTGEQERVLANLPMVIVGAGVSTCAPLLERG